MVMHTTTTVEDPENVVVAIPEAVKEAMTLIESSAPLVVSEGLAKLSHATFNHPVSKQAAGALGVIRLIAEAMTRNLETASVQEDGCHALRNVVFHVEPNVKLVREEGGIEAVLRAMRKHPENEAVQVEGCWALVVFCSNHEENVEAVKPSQAVIERAIHSHGNNAEISSKGRFLQALLA